jgi:hypothetical protein
MKQFSFNNNQKNIKRGFTFNKMENIIIYKIITSFKKNAYYLYHQF